MRKLTFLLLFVGSLVKAQNDSTFVDDRYIEDNYEFFRLLMRRAEKFDFSGVDVHFYLNELDRRGVREELQR